MNAKAIRTAVESHEQLPGPTKRLLLVDDNEPLREVLNEVVQNWSFAASTAATLQQARNVILTEKPFTVIVSDYQLPDGNGLEFLDWLRQDMRIHVPFLLMSGRVMRSPSATDDYRFLAKPFLMDEFRTHLEELSGLPLPPVPYRLTHAQEALASVYARCRPPKNQ